MSETVNQVSIFVPMLAVVALTFAAFLRMAAARGRAIKEGQDPGFYRAHLGSPEPEYATAAVRHYGNLFELPTVFYAACITAFVLGAVGPWLLGFAWAFVTGRLLQSVVHMSYNNPTHRGLGFIFSVPWLLAMWVAIAIAVFSRL